MGSEEREVRTQAASQNLLKWLLLLCATPIVAAIVAFVLYLIKEFFGGFLRKAGEDLYKKISSEEESTTSETP